MKFTIITVCYNSSAFLRDAILSVKNQTYQNIEYIIVDGRSTDGTIDIIRESEFLFGGGLRWISEKDEGLYDAMNKGIMMATGDVVGILNSDDFFYDNSVLKKIAAAFGTAEVEAIIGDIVFVKDSNHDKIIRYYSSRRWKPSKFAWGYMPPHPSFFIKRELFEKFGYYKIDYRIAADYELLIRYLLKAGISWRYEPIITTKMRMGGMSTNGFKSLLKLNNEIIRGCKENGVYTNKLMVYSKYLFKPFEFIFNG